MKRKTFEVACEIGFLVPIDALSEEEAINLAESLFRKKMKTAGIYHSQIEVHSSKDEGIEEYSLNGVPGCVLECKNPAFEGVVRLYNANQAGFPAKNPWVTLCEAHGSYGEYHTFELARKNLPTPSAWCEKCRQEVNSEGVKKCD